jgi:hypothetical protein
MICLYLGPFRLGQREHLPSQSRCPLAKRLTNLFVCPSLFDFYPQHPTSRSFTTNETSSMRLHCLEQLLCDTWLVAPFRAQIGRFELVREVLKPEISMIVVRWSSPPAYHIERTKLSTRLRDPGSHALAAGGGTFSVICICDGHPLRLGRRD